MYSSLICSFMRYFFIPSKLKRNVRRGIKLLVRDANLKLEFLFEGFFQSQKGILYKFTDLDGKNMDPGAERAFKFGNNECSTFLSIEGVTQLNRSKKRRSSRRKICSGPGPV